jgi:hypothetical protein
MTGRRRTAMVLGLGLTLFSCAHATAPREARKSSADLLLLRSERGLLAFDPVRRTSVTIGPEAVRIPRTSSFIAQDGGRLARVDASTGGRSLLPEAGPGYRLRTVSPSGRSVALLGEYRNDRTPILVVGTEGEGTVHRFNLRGRVVPEAFSTDDGRLFLIHYLEDAGRYRLIELNLTDGAVAPLGARIKQPAPTEMVGIGRAQVASPDGRILYTLYTRQPASFPHGRRPGQKAPAEGTAFVHVLNLEAGSAHCVELPESFGSGSIATDAMAIGPDGARLFVVDGRRGRATVVNTDTLRPEVVGSIVPPGGDGKISAAVDTAGRVFVARGLTIAAFDAATLTPAYSRTLPSSSSDIAVGSTGRLFVAAADGIYALDSGSERLEELRSGADSLVDVLIRLS